MLPKISKLTLYVALVVGVLYVAGIVVAISVRLLELTLGFEGGVMFHLYVIDFLKYGGDFVVGLVATSALLTSASSAQIENRPYLSLRMEPLENNSHSFALNANVINHGHIPANSVKIRFDHSLNGIQQTPFMSVVTPFIPPDDKGIWHRLDMTTGDLDRFISPSNKWVLTFFVTYDGVGTTSHKTTTELTYEPSLSTFSISGGVATEGVLAERTQKKVDFID